MFKIYQLYQRIGQYETTIAAILLFLCTIIIFFSAIARSFGRPINWSQDSALFLFSWSVFLSADAALRKNKLVKIEIVSRFFSPLLMKIITIICYGLITVFLLSLVIYGIRLSVISSSRVFQGIPGFSYTWVILSVPIGASLMLMTISVKFSELFEKNTRDN